MQGNNFCSLQEFCVRIQYSAVPVPKSTYVASFSWKEALCSGKGCSEVLLSAHGWLLQRLPCGSRALDGPPSRTEPCTSQAKGFWVFLASVPSFHLRCLNVSATAVWWDGKWVILCEVLPAWEWGMGNGTPLLPLLGPPAGCLLGLYWVLSHHLWQGRLN